MCQRMLGSDMRAQDENEEEILEEEKWVPAIPYIERHLARLKAEAEIEESQRKLQNLNLVDIEKSPPEEKEYKAAPGPSTSQPPPEQKSSAADSMVQGSARDGDDMDTDDDNKCSNEAPKLDPNFVGPRADIPLPTQNVIMYVVSDDEDDLSSSSSEVDNMINMNMQINSKHNNLY